jgi:hypothetical protein
MYYVPLCIDPTVDCVSMSLRSLFSRPRYYPRLFEIFSEGREYFEKIRKLEIQDI